MAIAPGDYKHAIKYDSTAGMTADANELVDLNISFARSGIYISKGVALNSIHNSTFQNNDTKYNYGSLPSFSGPAIGNLGTISNIYNNIFEKNSGGYNGVIPNGGTIENIYSNIFTNNVTTYGGIVNYGKLKNIYNNNFSHNRGNYPGVPTGYGGGISNVGTITMIFGNTFIDNEVTNGGGIYNSERIEAVFDNNFTNNISWDGGGIYNGDGNITSIYNNIFADNNTVNGGAILTFSSYKNKAIITNLYNNVFANNTARYQGGAIASFVGTITNLYNNTFTNNTAQNGGGIANYGIYWRSEHSEITKLHNNIFAYHAEAIYNYFSYIYDLNYNAYWHNAVDCTNCDRGGGSVDFTAPPFLGDNSDGNFLIVPSQVRIVRDKGINIGDDLFFNSKTIGVDRILDTGIRDIGYHYSPTVTTCSNGIKDGSETDIDCGGLICPACEERKSCLVNDDCISNYCNSNKVCDVPRDLFIEWIKPIQVVEDVPLVAGKATVVRVKVVNNGPEVETDVRLDYGNGKSPETKTKLIHTFSSEIVDFYSTPYTIAGTYQITATVDPDGTMPETNENNNTKTAEVNVVDVRDLKILFVPAYYFEYGHSFDDYRRDVNKTREFILGMYPIPEDKFPLWLQQTQFTTDRIPERSEPQTSHYKILLSELEQYHLRYYLGVDRVIGILHPGWSWGRSTHGGGGEAASLSAIFEPSGYHYRVGAHELAHTYKFCDEYNYTLWSLQGLKLFLSLQGGCANSFPQQCSGEEGARNCLGSIDINGFWVAKEEQRKTRVDQDINYYCMMGNADDENTWIEDADYLYLLKEFQTPHTDLNKVIIISGMAYKNGEIDFNPFYLTESIITKIPDGNYVLELQNINGEVIKDYNFDSTFIFDPSTDSNAVPFVFTIPYNSNIHKIVGKYFNETKDERIITPNAPTVEINSPTGGEIWSGIHTMNWNANDMDGDENLTYTLEYSDDNGEKWYLITTGYNETSYNLNVDRLQPGNAHRIRVSASDGVRVGYDDSGAFTIQNPSIDIQPFIWNFGSIAQGSIISKDFNITNSGNVDLKVNGYSAPANVNVLGPSLPLTLLVGQSIQFRVDLNTALLEGAIDENAVFYSNDPDEAEKRFFIEGSVFVPKTMDGNLHLSDMNSYLKEQTHYSGTASAKMILDYVREAAGYPLLPQDTIYNYGHKFNRSENSELLELDANAMYTMLGHFDPYDFIISEPYDQFDSLADGNPYQGYNFSIETFDANTDSNAVTKYMRDIAHWIAYPVKRKAWWLDKELVAKPNTPAAIPLYGNYSNWAVINGFAASSNPVANPDTNPWQSKEITLHGFWLTDPATNGIGQHVYVTASDANAIYFKPMDVNDIYKGKYLQVGEPPVLPPEELMSNIELESDAEVEIVEPVADSANLEFVGVEGKIEKPKTKATSVGGIMATGISEDRKTAVEDKKSWRDLVDSHLLFDQEAIAAFEDAEITEPILVQELDKGQNYYLVPFKKQGLTAGVIMLDAEQGYFKQASWTTEPEQYPAVGEQNAVSFVKREINPKPTESLAVEFNSFEEASAQLAWQPNNYSQSPFKPYWIIEMEGGKWIVTQEGKLFEVTPTTSPKAGTQVIEIATIPPESDDFTSTGKYFEIINPNLENESFTATLTFFYNDADNDGIVDGTNINEQKLNAYYFKEEKGWTEIAEPERNTEANTIKVTVNHFSLFALMAKEPEQRTAQPPAQNNASGGGGSSGGSSRGNSIGQRVDSDGDIENTLEVPAKDVGENKKLKEEPTDGMKTAGKVAKKEDKKEPNGSELQVAPIGLAALSGDKMIAILFAGLLIAIILSTRMYLAKKKKSR